MIRRLLLAVAAAALALVSAPVLAQDAWPARPVKVIVSVPPGGTSDAQPDAPRVGGITPFLQIMALADFNGRMMAPHFAMEIHLHLAAACAHEPWLEHFEWLGPMFNEQMQLKDGRMWVSDRPGLGFSLSELARRWTTETALFGQPA